MNPNNPTKFVNWNRYFSGNKGAAESEAEKMARKQREAAQKAQQQTQGALGKFADQAGVGQAALAPKVNQSLQTPTTNVGQGAVRAPAGTQNAPAPAMPQSAPGMAPAAAISEAEAKSKGTYGGPSELVNTDYGKGALEASLAAQKGLNQLGNEAGIEALYQDANKGLTSGEARFGSALTGTAGRGRFDKLRGEFSLQKDWEAAEEKARGLAAMGTEQARAAADRWAQYADQLKQQQAGGLDPNRELGYGPNGESSGGDPRGVGVTGVGGAANARPDVDADTQARRVKNHTQSWADFNGAGSPFGNESARFPGMTEAVWKQLTPAERAELDALIERNAGNDERAAWTQKILAAHGNRG